MGLDDAARVERLGTSIKSPWSFYSIRNVSSTLYFVPLILDS